MHVSIKFTMPPIVLGRVSRLGNIFMAAAHVATMSCSMGTGNRIVLNDVIVKDIDKKFAGLGRQLIKIEHAHQAYFHRL